MIKNKITLKELLGKSGDYRQTKGLKLIIPEFQRGYSWTSDQLTEFWEDLLKAYKNKEIPGFSSIGVMYFFTDDNKNWEIVDGQQRMTTTIILLEAFQYILKSDEIKHNIYDVNNSRIINGYSKDCLLEKNYVKFFDNYIHEFKPVTEEEFADASLNNFRDTLINFQNWIKETFKTHDERVGFYDFLINNIYFWPYIENDRNVRIDLFMKLNSRGRELSFTTLLKSYLYGEDKFKLKFSNDNTEVTLPVAQYYEHNIEEELFKTYFVSVKSAKKEGEVKKAAANFYLFYSNKYAPAITNKDSEISNDKPLFFSYTKLVKAVFTETKKLPDEEAAKYLENFMSAMRIYMHRYIRYCCKNADEICNKLIDIDVKRYCPLIAYVDITFEKTEKEKVDIIKELLFVYSYSRRIKWMYDNRIQIENKYKTEQLNPRSLGFEELTRNLRTNSYSLDDAIQYVKNLLTTELKASISNYFAYDHSKLEGYGKQNVVKEQEQYYIDLVNKHNLDLLI